MAEENFNIMVQTLDLSTARNFSLISSGMYDTLLVREISDLNANIQIKFDTTGDAGIPISPGDTFNFRQENTTKAFNRLYLYNDAVVGSVVFILSRGVEIRKLLRVTADCIQEGIVHGVVTIGILPTPIPAVALTNRINLLLVNRSGATIYLGSSSVTIPAGADPGIPLENNAQMSFTIGQGVVLYGVAVAPVDLNYLEGA